METNTTNTNDSSEESRRIARIMAQIAALRKTIAAYQEKINQIKEAMERVSSCPRDGISEANSSFKWLVNNMDNFWTATDSVSIAKVKDILTKVGNECGSGGRILSQEGAVMAAAEAKIAEYEAKIAECEARIAELSASI